MRAVVTGGAGFVGSDLVRRLTELAWQVSVVDDLSSGYAESLGPFAGVRLLRGDVRDERPLEEALAGVDVVFHAAASVGNKRSIDFPLSGAETNVIGTVKVLSAARRAGARKVVFSSSAAVFGELKALPITEGHPCEPDTPYGATKLGAEKECLAFAKVYGLETVALRYFNVYGPNQRFDAYGNAIPIFVFQVLRGETVTIFGDGGQTRDFVNVRDVVEANIGAAMARGVSGVFNVGSGMQVSIDVLVQKLVCATGAECEVRHGPARPGDVRNSLADVTAARGAFGYEPRVSLDEGLQEYVRWARSEVQAG